MADEITQNAGDGAQPPEKTFTQSDLDRIVKERIERERGKYADYDDLKAKAGKLSEIENANKTEAEKLASRLAEIEKSLGIKDQTIAKLTDELTGTKRQSLAASVAGRLGAHDPQDANILAAISAIDPAGANAEKEIEAAMKTLAERKPYLFKAAQPAGAPRLEGFNPGTSGAAETDRQRVAKLLSATGVGNYGPLG